MRVVTLHAQDNQSASLECVLQSLGCYIGGVYLGMTVRRAACAMSVPTFYTISECSRRCSGKQPVLVSKAVQHILAQKALDGSCHAN